MSSKCIFEAKPSWESGHVFILTSLEVFLKVQFLTNTPSTGSSSGYFPRLPTLMPCPGPHLTFVMLICLLPSPVWMVVSIMLIPIDRPMWLPSVLGLFSGAITLTREKVTFSPLNTFMWNCLLSREIMSWIKELVTKSNLIFCSQQHSISQTLLILMHIN